MEFVEKFFDLDTLKTLAINKIVIQTKFFFLFVGVIILLGVRETTNINKTIIPLI